MHPIQGGGGAPEGKQVSNISIEDGVEPNVTRENFGIFRDFLENFEIFKDF